MQLILAVAAGLILATYYILTRIVEGDDDPAEPPLATSSIPFVGHALGLMKKRTDYFLQLYRETGLPIFSLCVGTHKLYIINSPDLIKLVQKRPKVFTFHVVTAHFSKIVCCLSREAKDVIDLNIDGESGDRSYVISLHKMIHSVLAPGPVLDRMNCSMIENIAKSMQQLGQVADRGNKLMLSHWLRHTITVATTNAVYGPLNPFLDPKVEKAFWDFHDNLELLLLNFLPSTIISKGYKARDIVVDAFYQYFTRNGHESGCALVQGQYEHNVNHKMPILDIARSEVGGAIAMLVNTTPSAFWMLYSVYSEPDLLQDCRKELDAIVTTIKSPQGQLRRVADIADSKAHCLLLTSILTETLRYRSTAFGVRKVMQDAISDGKYLLKKDRTIMMPARVLHSDPNLWGADVQDFRPRRFMKDNDKAGTAKYDPVVFRGFGGGVSLCPGRHFATTEIFAIVVMTILRYDITVCTGWKPPNTHKTSIGSGVMEPDTDIEVQVSFRPGFETGEWVYG